MQLIAGLSLYVYVTKIQKNTNVILSHDANDFSKFNIEVTDVLLNKDDFGHGQLTREKRLIPDGRAPHPLW